MRTVGHNDLVKAKNIAWLTIPAGLIVSSIICSLFYYQSTVNEEYDSANTVASRSLFQKALVIYGISTSKYTNISRYCCSDRNSCTTILHYRSKPETIWTSCFNRRCSVGSENSNKFPSNAKYLSKRGSLITFTKHFSGQSSRLLMHNCYTALQSLLDTLGIF